MGSILPADSWSRIIDVISAVARNAAAANSATETAWQNNERGTLEPIHELMEICAVYAGLASTDIFERFEAGMITAATAWPAAVPALRELVDDIGRMNGYIHARGLWRLHLYLNACP